MILSGLRAAFLLREEVLCLHGRQLASYGMARLFAVKTGLHRELTEQGAFMGQFLRKRYSFRMRYA